MESEPPESAQGSRDPFCIFMVAEALESLRGQGFCPHQVAAHLGRPGEHHPIPCDPTLVSQLLPEGEACQIALLRTFDVSAPARDVAEIAEDLCLLRSVAERASQSEGFLSEGQALARVTYPVDEPPQPRKGSQTFDPRPPRVGSEGA